MMEARHTSLRLRFWGGRRGVTLWASLLTAAASVLIGGCTESPVDPLSSTEVQFNRGGKPGKPTGPQPAVIDIIHTASLISGKRARLSPQGHQKNGKKGCPETDLRTATITFEGVQYDDATLRFRVVDDPDNASPSQRRKGTGTLNFGDFAVCDIGLRFNPDVTGYEGTHALDVTESPLPGGGTLWQLRSKPAPENLAGCGSEDGTVRLVEMDIQIDVAVP
jgi:hypothetical protein